MKTKGTPRAVKKLSIDLTKENYEELLKIKQTSNLSFGKIINTVLEEVLNETEVC